jgi:hypothetical protein
VTTGRERTELGAATGSVSALATASSSASGSRHVGRTRSRARDLPSLLADDSKLAQVLGIPDFGEDPDVDAARLKRLRRATGRAADPDVDAARLKRLRRATGRAADPDAATSSRKAPCATPTPPTSPSPSPARPTSPRGRPMTPTPGPPLRRTATRRCRPSNRLRTSSSG